MTVFLCTRSRSTQKSKKTAIGMAEVYCRNLDCRRTSQDPFGDGWGYMICDQKLMTFGYPVCRNCLENYSTQRDRSSLFFHPNGFSNCVWSIGPLQRVETKKLDPISSKMVLMLKKRMNVIVYDNNLQCLHCKEWLVGSKDAHVCKFVPKMILQYTFH